MFGLSMGYLLGGLYFTHEPTLQKLCKIWRIRAASVIFQTSLQAEVYYVQKGAKIDFV